MKNLLSSVLALSFALVSTLDIDPSLQGCTAEDSMVALIVCSPLVYGLKAEMTKHKGVKAEPEVYKNMSVLCDKTMNCLGKLKCNKAVEANAMFREACDGLHILGADLQTCLPKFHKAVHEKKYECSKSIDFDSSDMTKRREAYNSGKACFMEIVKKECSSVPVNYFETQYDQYVDIRTNRPAQCEGNHHNLEALKCSHFALSFKEKSSVMETGFQVNDTNILEAIDLCEKAANCDACKLKSISLHEACKALRVLNNEASVCAMKMKKMDVDKSKYPCMKKEMRCARSKEDLKCVAGAMKEYCGQTAADDFEKNADYIMKMTQC